MNHRRMIARLIRMPPIESMNQALCTDEAMAPVITAATLDQTAQKGGPLGASPGDTTVLPPLQVSDGAGSAHRR